MAKGEGHVTVAGMVMEVSLQLPMPDTYGVRFQLHMLAKQSTNLKALAAATTEKGTVELAQHPQGLSWVLEDSFESADIYIETVPISLNVQVAAFFTPFADLMQNIDRYNWL